MILGIICFILSIIGLICYNTGITIMIYIAGATIIIEVIVGVITGQSKSIISPLFFGIIGAFIVKPAIDGFFIGLCIENIILFILGIIILITGSKTLKNK